MRRRASDQSCTVNGNNGVKLVSIRFQIEDDQETWTYSVNEKDHLGVKKMFCVFSVGLFYIVKCMSSYLLELCSVLVLLFMVSFCLSSFYYVLKLLLFNKGIHSQNNYLDDSLL